MAATRTFLQMRDRARQLADMVGSTFVSEAELKEIINEACQDLYDILILHRGLAYYSVQTDIAVSSSTGSYGLPSDFYRLTSVRIKDGNNFWPLRAFEEVEVPALEQAEASGGYSLFQTRYSIRGPGGLVASTNIILLPKPTGSWTLKIGYIPAFQRLTLDSDTFDGINGWEKWVELTAAIEMLNKEESDSSALLGERNRIEARIRTLAPGRDEHRPPRIADTRGDWADTWYAWDSRRDWDL